MKYAICLSLAVSLTSLIPAALPAHAQTGHNLLSPSQKSSLKSLGIKVAIPQYVPQGFRVAAIRTEPCRAGDRRDANGVCRFGPEYAVLYRNAQNHCFVVNSVGGGIGGPSGQYTRAVNTRLLGKVNVNVGIGMGEPITEAIANTPQANVWTFPAGKSPFYSVATRAGRGDRIDSTATCSTRAYMTPNELIKIVQSLDWLP
ncbi:MAG: hypothetical protein DCE90_19600 [Pseudanabaena sp.]|nr:MAG: hypothetical protein DCE90_19600 [Pseudanabaena sp.]